MFPVPVHSSNLGTSELGTRNSEPGTEQRTRTRNSESGTGNSRYHFTAYIFVNPFLAFVTVNEPSGFAEILIQ
jgi:hypothetical protein